LCLEYANGNLSFDTITSKAEDIVPSLSSYIIEIGDQLTVEGRKGELNKTVELVLRITDLSVEVVDGYDRHLFDAFIANYAEGESLDRAIDTQLSLKRLSLDSRVEEQRDDWTRSRVLDRGCEKWITYRQRTLHEEVLETKVRTEIKVRSRQVEGEEHRSESYITEH